MLGQPDMPPAVPAPSAPPKFQGGLLCGIGGERRSRGDPCGLGARPGDCMLIKMCSRCSWGSRCPPTAGRGALPQRPKSASAGAVGSAGAGGIFGGDPGRPPGGGGAPRWMLAGMAAGSPASTAKRTLVGGCVGRIIMVDERRGRGAAVGVWRGEVWWRRC